MVARGTLLLLAVISLVYFRSSKCFPTNLTTEQLNIQEAKKESVLPEIGHITVNDSSDGKIFCLLRENHLRCVKAANAESVQNQESVPREFLEIDEDWSWFKATGGHFTLCIPEQLENYSSPNQTLRKTNDPDLICSIVIAAGNNTFNKQIVRFRQEYMEFEAYPEQFLLVDPKGVEFCAFPPLTTVNVRCEKMPTFKSCKASCAYGHTFDEGIERIHHCNYSDSVWSPPFEECTPFIDCSLKLIHNGTLSCEGYHAGQKGPPSCDIACDMYEENDALEKQTYFCKIDGTWEPPLPFCVELGGGFHLAKMPDVVEHSP